MRYRKFGKTGLDISVLTTGTWAIGGDGWGDVDKKQSIAAIHAMFDNGVNFIDTAPVYGRGYSEEVVGEALSTVDRSKIYLSTKVGITWPDGPDKGIVKNASYDNIMAECEISLKRMRTDYIDVYIVHWPDIHTNAPASETMKALLELKKAGKIRFIGVSNYSVEQIEELRQYGPVDLHQPPFSMVNRGATKLMEWTHGQGIASMTYGSLGAGILSGAFRSIPDFDPKDTRLNFYDYFKEPKFSKIMELLKTLDKVAEAHGGVPVAQVTINWMAQHPLVDTSLVGVRNPGEAKENCAATEWELTNDEIAMINKAIDDTMGPA